MSEREHAVELVNAAFDQGCWQRRPRSSTAAASSFAPIARAPASPRTGISLKRNRRRRRPHHLRPAAAAPARAGRAGIAPPKLRRAGFSATTRQGIKNTSSPAGNVGERARRRASQRGFRSGVLAASTPYLHSGRIVGSLRSPELQRRPEPEYHQNGIGAAGDLTICGQQPLRRPEQVEQASRRRNCAAPDSRPPPAKG